MVLYAPKGFFINDQNILYLCCVGGCNFKQQPVFENTLRLKNGQTNF